MQNFSPRSSPRLKASMVLLSLAVYFALDALDQLSCSKDNRPGSSSLNRLGFGSTSRDEPSGINDTFALKKWAHHDNKPANRRPRRTLLMLPRIQQVEAIRMLRLDVPQTIQSGQPLKLRCLYDAKGDRLQSLSWYKNGREFYRYQPFERRQPVLAFNVTGVNIDFSKSRNNTLVLVNTTSDTSGRYKCEVTGNTFQEVNMETYIQVQTAASGVGFSLIHIHMATQFAWVLVSTSFVIMNAIL